MNSMTLGKWNPVSSIKAENLFKTCYKPQIVRGATEISSENFLPVTFSI